MIFWLITHLLAFTTVGLLSIQKAQARWGWSLFISDSFAFAGKSNESPQKTKKKSKKKIKNKKTKPAAQAPADPFYKSKVLDKIYKRQAKRMKRIDQYKKKGWVGEADNGLLKIRDFRGLKEAERKLFEKAIKVENNDRQRIFKEMEKGARYTAKDKVFMRRRYFELQREVDAKGTYFFQGDHWMKKE